MHWPVGGNTMKRGTWTSALILMLLSLAVVVPLHLAAAQDPTPSDDQVNRIARQLYCPVCENTPLDVCPTEACRQWRDLIRQKLSEGWSEKQIQQYFVEQYGARVLSEPPRTGLNWLVYILPPVFILAGVVILVRSFRAWRPAHRPDDSESEAAGVAAPDEYVQRIEDELKKRG